MIRNRFLEAKNPRTTYTYTVNGNVYEFTSGTFSSNTGFCHRTELRCNGTLIGKSQTNYYNRTWETFKYQSSMLKTIGKSDIDVDDEKILTDAIEHGKLTLTESQHASHMMQRDGSVTIDGINFIDITKYIGAPAGTAVLLYNGKLIMHRFDKKSNDYKKSEIRRYLRSGEFDRDAGIDFDYDLIDLLSDEEAEKLPVSVREYEDWWWLRSPGFDSGNAEIVYEDGDVAYFGDYVESDGGAARPFLIVDFDELNNSDNTIEESFDSSLHDEGTLNREYVCRYCMQALQSRGEYGRKHPASIYVGPDKEIDCAWCGESISDDDAYEW